MGHQEDQLDPLSEATLNEINSNRKILSVGYQNDIRPYLSISNCLVLPSYREGFPNVVMQAGAMDLPSIVTNINGCNEIIIDNINGLLVKSKNCYELEKAMYKIFNNPLLYDKLKSSSRGLITSRFEQKKVWKTILDEYRELENDLIYNNELKTITKKYYPVNLRQINFSNYLLSLLFLFFNSNK